LVWASVPAAAPARAELKNVVRVGVLQDPKTLNLWLASDAWSGRVLGLVYDPLYRREPREGKLIPWLAAAPPRYDAGSLTCLVRLRPARWADGRPFTAADVVFTAALIKRFRVPRHYSKWRFVSRVEALGPRLVRFTLERPQAVFLTRTLTTPLVPRHQWEPIVRDLAGRKYALKRLLHTRLKDPVGTGPFRMARWRRGVFVYLERNPHFFARGLTIAGHRLGPYIAGIILKVYGTADAAVLALRKGEIDYYWNSIQPGYLAELRGDPHIRIYTSKKSGMYFLGFNLRRRPFSDPAFRRAVAVLVAKEFIIRRILQGYGEVMHSVVPPGNRLYYNPRVPRYGQGLSREQRIRLAWRILKEAGYSWRVPPVDAAGRVQPGEGLCRPDGRPVAEFAILTPPADYDPHRAMSGQMIQEWLRAVGIPAYARPMAFGALIERVKVRRDFACFVLGYGKLSLDPAYLRAFFHSRGDRPRGWNLSGYRNPDFDRLAEASDAAMDPARRRRLVLRMQELIMRDVPYLPLYNPLVLEGVRRDRFRGWVPALGGIGNLWSFCSIRAVGETQP
jgi:ABC-type transport system substrate-binding protein